MNMTMGLPVYLQNYGPVAYPQMFVTQIPQQAPQGPTMLSADPVTTYAKSANQTCAEGDKANQEKRITIKSSGCQTESQLYQPTTIMT